MVELVLIGKLLNNVLAVSLERMATPGSYGSSRDSNIIIFTQHLLNIFGFITVLVRGPVVCPPGAVVIATKRSAFILSRRKVARFRLTTVRSRVITKRPFCAFRSDKS